MKNIKIPFLLMTMFFISLLVGCKSEEDKVIGYWKSENEIYHGTYSKIETIVIKKDSISIDGRDVIPIELQYLLICSFTYITLSLYISFFLPL